jgi:hypothetical protein
MRAVAAAPRPAMGPVHGRERHLPRLLRHSGLAAAAVMRVRRDDGRGLERPSRH